MANQTEEQMRREARRRSLKRRHHRQLFIVVAAIVVVLFLANLLTKSREYSDTENRSLAQRPGIMAGGLRDGTYFKDFDTYYSDQFVLRDQFVKLKFIGNWLLHIRESSGVLIGKDKYQFEIPVSPDEAQEKSTIKKINDFYNLEPGIETRMMIVPGSSAILTDKLPANAAVADQAKDIKDFYEQIDDGIETIDVTGILRRSDPDNLYYRTDHHWTSGGAFTVFKSVAGKLGIEAPVGYDHYTVSTSFKGTLSSKSGDFVGKDSVEIYAPKSDKVNYYVTYPDSQEKRSSIFKPEMLKTKDKYTVFFGGNHPLVEINTTADTGRNLLVLKDSYANSFMQFMTPYYDRIIMVDPRYYYDNINMVISNYDINEILYLYSADTLFSDTSLSDALEAAIDAQTEEEQKAKKEKDGDDAEADTAGQAETTADGSGSDDGESATSEDSGDTEDTGEADDAAEDQEDDGSGGGT